MDGYLWAWVGGVLIGLAATGLLLFNGRTAGISGIFSGVLKPQIGDFSWRAYFVGGLVLGGIALYATRPDVFPSAAAASNTTNMPLLAAAGLLVGFGTRLGGGCTSGHGVCGLARLSPRSLVATLTFIATGAATVLAMRLIAG